MKKQYMVPLAIAGTLGAATPPLAQVYAGFGGGYAILEKGSGPMAEVELGKSTSQRTELFLMPDVELTPKGSAFNLKLGFRWSLIEDRLNLMPITGLSLGSPFGEGNTYSPILGGRLEVQKGNFRIFVESLQKRHPRHTEINGIREVNGLANSNQSFRVGINYRPKRKN